jgi:hypothetical protein
MMNTMDVETATAKAGTTRTTNPVETVRDAGDGYLMIAVIRIPEVENGNNVLLFHRLINSNSRRLRAPMWNSEI